MPSWQAGRVRQWLGAVEAADVETALRSLPLSTWKRRRSPVASARGCELPRSYEGDRLPFGSLPRHGLADVFVVAMRAAGHD